MSYSPHSKTFWALATQITLSMNGPNYSLACPSHYHHEQAWDFQTLKLRYSITRIMEIRLKAIFPFMASTKLSFFRLTKAVSHFG